MGPDLGAEVVALPRLQPAPQMGFLSVNGGGVSWVPEPTGFPLFLRGGPVSGQVGEMQAEGGVQVEGKS